MNKVVDIKDLQVAIANNDIESNKQVATKLFNELATNKTYVSLSCNQIGINDHRVIAVNIKQPIYLVNPKVIKREVQITPIEACATFPNKMITTMCHAYIEVTCDNEPAPLKFGNKYADKITDINLLQAIYVQQAIDMLDGITMFDRQVIKPEPIKAEKTHGRNEFVVLQKEGLTALTMKYKYIDRYLADGWVIKPN